MAGEISLVPSFEIGTGENRAFFPIRTADKGAGVLSCPPSSI